MSRRCPEGWKRMWERLEGPLQVCRRPQVFYRRSHSVRLSRRSHVSQRVASTSEQPSQSWALKSRHCGLLVKACGPSGHSGHLLKLAKAPSGHSGHLLKLAKHLLDILDNWREPLAPRRRACWEDSVITAAWSLGGRRDRSSRAGLGLAALAHPGFVRIRIAVVEYGRCKVGASTAPRRRSQNPSHARRRAASRRRERALRSARLAPARDGRRARSRSHLSIPTLRARCVARDRGITTEPQRGARPAPPSHELVSRPPRRRKPTRCLKA